MDKNKKNKTNVSNANLKTFHFLINYDLSNLIGDNGGKGRGTLNGHRVSRLNRRQSKRHSKSNLNKTITKTKQTNFIQRTFI